jgi:diguanylate cyclase (GGDEF)-like protein/PAS domain S-box-containing protein
VGTLLAGMLISVFLHYVVFGLEQTRSSFDFTRRQEMRVAVIKRSFDEAGEALRAINLLFQADDEVTDEQFVRFIRPLIDTYPYVHALASYRFVRGDERAAYEAERRRHWPDFEITEKSGGGFVRAGERPLYLVLDMVAPTARNTIAHGYDILSFPPHGLLAERAIDAGKVMASGLVPMIEPRGRLGIVIELPVYGRPLPPDAGPAERRAAARGLSEVLIDVVVLIEQNLRRANPPSGVEITLSGQVDGQQTMREVGHVGSTALDEPAFLGKLVGAEIFDRTERFMVAGQEWELRSRTREPAIVHLGSVLILLAGLGFSIAAAAHVQGRARRVETIENLVDERTADLRRTSEALRLHQRAIESSANSVILVDALAEGTPIIHVNPAFQRLHGRSAEEVIGQPIDMLAPDEDEQPAIHELRHALRERREGHAVLQLTRKDGTKWFAEIYLAPVNDEHGVTDHFVITEYDVTTARQYEAELERRARYDTLTGLPNRVLLTDRIERAIAHARMHGCPVWVVALDLDHFKHVNDSLGHTAGNRLLRQAGERMQALLGETDTVARTGDDEFVLLLDKRADERQAAATVNEVLAAIAAPFIEQEQRLFITCSAGIAGYPGDGSDAETLVKQAQIALYRAKEGGRNTVRFYLPSMNERALERLALVDAMRHAMSYNEFELYYQPQIELASGTVIGMEALLRWRHPQMGMLRPDRFIALAEETGLIVPLGTWALRAACAQTAAWHRSGLGPLRIAVNLSSRQFNDASLPQLIGSILLETGLPATSLEIELTESLMMENVEAAIATMRELKAMGVQLSIDDFGTGYSSLSYLKRFPVDVLKIDQSFVRDIEHDANSTSMVAAIISLSHDLGLRVIAEGVETQAQLDFLRGRGCDEVQGYLFTRPAPGRDFEQFVKDSFKRSQPLDTPSTH